MNSTSIKVTIALLLVLACAQSAISASVSQTVTIRDNGGMLKALQFGLDPAATNGIDTALGEAQLPPSPPAGVFDARFVSEDLPGISLGQGTWKDYRAGDIYSIGTWIYELKYQTVQGRTITVSWSLPGNISGRLQDIITGTLIDVPMTGSGSYTITNPSAFSKLKMSVTFDEALPIQLVSFTATRNGAADVRLDWSTLSEVNNYGFYVQRRPAGNPEFETLPNSFVAGHGTTNTPQYYTYLDVQVESGTWFYRLQQIDLDGDEFLSEPVQVNITTGVNETTPIRFNLQQNYPNPFNPSTTIAYDLPVGTKVVLTIHDVLGRRVAMPVNEEQASGHKLVEWNASGFASGVYYYHLQAGGFTATRRLILLR